MALPAGTRLGAYEILTLIGSGGMGEVYRAHDTRLGRDVAIKILPAAYTADPERLGRFEREARVLAAVNHPHIAAIYGFEQQDGLHALVLELVDGETLADRLARGPLPVREALQIGRQIADALDAAHQRGIVHRDLKPANMAMTRDGVVKILDFGLAKTDPAESPAELTHSPTVFGPTVSGVLLGTAPYMSPEQARGKPVDKRTDIWAFGCVMYELLTGRRAFSGETTSDVVGAILEREPDWSRLPAAAPASVRRLLRRCLEKDPNERLRDIGDARVELGEAWLAGHARVRRAAAAAATIAVVAIAVTLWFSLARTPRPATSPSEYIQLTDVTDAAMTPSVSPDGRLVTFKRGSDPFLGPGQIYVKVLPKGDAVRLTDDSNAGKYGPVFTPDASRVAYTQLTAEGASLSWDTWTVPVLGGPPTRLLPNASGLTWLPNRAVLFSEITGGGLHMQVVSATESRAQSHLVYSPALEMGMAHYSAASPDLRSVLIVEMGRSHGFDSPCRLVPFDGSSPGQSVGPDGNCYSAEWSPDGRWMYFAASVGGHSHLWRQRFPGGTPEQITFGTTEEEGLAVVPDGRSLITSVGRRLSAIWAHEAGGERPITSEGYASDARLSGDGTKAFYRDSGTAPAANDIGPTPAGELRMVDLKSGHAETVLPGVPVTGYDVSPDGRDVVFGTAEGGESVLWIGPTNRSASPRVLVRSADQASFGGPDMIVFREISGQTNFLAQIHVDGRGHQRIRSSPINEKRGVSPDGKWVAAVVPLAKDDPRLSDPLAVLYDTMAISTDAGSMVKLCNGACLVRWSGDGKFLYVSTDRTYVLPIDRGRSLPNLPPAGISVGEVPNNLPTAQVIGEAFVAPGSSPSTYLFTRVELRANLFQIPLH